MTVRPLLLSIMLLALAACGQPEAEPKLETVISDNTRVTDSNTRASLVKLSEDGNLQFSSSTPFLDNLKAGDVLASEPSPAAPAGYLKKVKAVKLEGGAVIVETEQAELSDAVLQTDSSFERQLTPADLASSTGLQKNIRLQRASKSARADRFEYEVNFDNTVLFDNDGNKDTKEDQLRVDGTLFFSDPLIGMDAGLTFKKIFGIPTPIPDGVKFKLGLQFKQEVRLGVFAGIKLKHKEEIPLFKQIYKPIVFFIGPVSIVLIPQINVTLKLDGEFNAKVSFQAQAVVDVGLGIEFKKEFKDVKNLKDLKFKDINAAEIRFDADGGVAQGSVKARAELLVDGSISLYGIAGAFVGLNASLQFDGQIPRPKGKPAWTLQGAIDARVGLSLDLIFKRLKTDRKLLNLVFNLAEAVNQAPKVNLSSLDGKKIQLNQALFQFPFTSFGLVTDPDGDIVTNITWSTDRDGVIDTGSDINHTFTAPGVRVLTVTAADPEGATSNTTATFEVVNTPPDVNVVRPRTNETVTRGVGFVLLGSALDPNEGKLDCTKLRWKSSNSSDPMPSNNCPDSNGLVRVKFASVGQRTITLTGTDSLGASTSVSVAVTVEDNGKPSVTILEPEELQKLGTAGKFPPVAAKAFLEDPDTDTLTYIWQWVSLSGTVVNDITKTVFGAKKWRNDQ